MCCLPNGMGPDRQTRIITTMNATTETAVPATVVTWGAHSIDVATIPLQSLTVMVRRTLAHMLGNEVASKVLSRAEAAAKEGAPMTDAQKEALTTEFRTDIIAAINEGKLAIRASAGPKADPIESRMAKIALKEITTILTTQGIKVPKGDDTITLDVGGVPTQMSRDTLVDRRLAREGDRIRKEAEAELRAEARKADKIKAAAGAAEGKTADALGL